MNDILLKMNSQHVTLLVLLHLSAAFDTFNHKILLERLQHDIGISRVPLQWFKSYFSNRSQRIAVQGTLSRLLISIVAFPKLPASVHCSTSSMHQSC